MLPREIQTHCLTFFVCMLQIAAAENVLVHPEALSAAENPLETGFSDTLIAKPLTESLVKSKPEAVEPEHSTPEIPITTPFITTTETPERIVTINSVRFFPTTTPSPTPLPETTTAELPVATEATSSTPTPTLRPLPEVSTPIIALSKTTSPLPLDASTPTQSPPSPLPPHDSSKAIVEPASSSLNSSEDGLKPLISTVDPLKLSSTPLVPSELPATSPEGGEETTTEGPIILRPPQKSTPGPIFIPAPLKLQVTCSICGQENVFKYSYNEPHNCQRCGGALESPTSKFSPPVRRYVARGRTNDVPQRPFSPNKPSLAPQKYVFPQAKVAGRTLDQPMPEPQVAIRADVDLNAKNLLKRRENSARTDLYKQSIGIPPVHHQTRQSALAPPLQSRSHLLPLTSPLPAQPLNGNQLRLKPQPKAEWDWSIPSWLFGSSSNTDAELKPEAQAPEKTVRDAPEEPIVKTPAQNPVSAFFNCPFAKIKQ